MTDRDALFQAVAIDFEVGLSRAYDRLNISEFKPTIYHTHAATTPGDSCDIAYISLSLAVPVPLEAPCATAPLATYRIDIYRCWPMQDGLDVPFEEQQTAAFGLQRDAAALWELAALNYRKELLTIPELGCDAVQFGDMRPIQPNGGLTGWTFPIAVSIWGIATGP